MSNRCVLNGLNRQFACLQQMCTKWPQQAVCMSATDVYKMVLAGRSHVCDRCVLYGLCRQLAFLKQICTEWSGLANTYDFFQHYIVMISL